MHKARKKYFYPLLFIVFFSLCNTSVLSSSVPKRISFEKKIRKKSRHQLNFVYKVQKGNTIYSILRYFQPNKENFADLIKTIKDLNPQIKNIDKIYPGQKIRLPGKLNKNATPRDSFPNKYHQLVGNYRTKKYTVKSGDYIVKILQEEANLSRKLIFNEYLQLFKELNPNISNIQNLQVGQEITLPLPAKKNAQAKQSKTPPISEAKENEQTSSYSEDSKNFSFLEKADPNKYMALAMLKKMGFEFAKNKQLFLPSESNKWHRLDSSQNPLIVAPWGEKYIFLSESLPQSLLKQIRKQEIIVCKVESSWNIKKLFSKIEKRSNKKIIFWSPRQTLLINKGEHVLEIQGDYVFVLNINPQSYFLFIKNKSEKTKISSLLSGYLAQENISVYSLEKKGKITKRLTKEHPSSDKLYIPVKSRSEILSLISKEKTKKKIKLEKLQTGKNFLKSLQKKQLAHKKNLRLRCLKSSKNRIVINIRGTKLQSTQENLLLLPPAQQENKYLLSLLNLYGYPAFVLSKQ